MQPIRATVGRNAGFFKRWLDHRLTNSPCRVIVPAAQQIKHDRIPEADDAFARFE